MPASKAATASAKVVMGPAGVRFAAVRTPENVPEVVPAGRFGNGKITGPFVPGVPKWMWPAATELVRGGPPASNPNLMVKSISVRELRRVNVARPMAGEEVEGVSPAPDKGVTKMKSA